jgi:hypothetical protein
VAAASTHDYFSGIRNTEFARTLNPSLQDFKTWLSNIKNAIPIK